MSIVGKKSGDVGAKEAMRVEELVEREETSE